MAHMQNCTAFAQVHREDGSTSYDYFQNQGKKTKAAEPEVQSPVPTEEAISTMSVKELKRFLIESKVAHADCVEKSDLVGRSLEVVRGQNAGSST